MKGVTKVTPFLGQTITIMSGKCEGSHIFYGYNVWGFNTKLFAIFLRLCSPILGGYRGQGDG